MTVNTNTLQNLQRLDAIEEELMIRDISVRQNIKRSFATLDSTKSPRQLLFDTLALNHKVLQTLSSDDFLYNLDLSCSMCGQPSVVVLREAGQVRVECTHCGLKYYEG